MRLSSLCGEASQILSGKSQLGTETIDYALRAWIAADARGNCDFPRVTDCARDNDVKLIPDPSLFEITNGWIAACGVALYAPQLGTLGQWFGLASAILHDHCLEHTNADAALLSLEIAVPADLIRLPLQLVSVCQPELPIELIALRRSGGSGVSGVRTIRKHL
jgi:hypothetical protein